MSSARSPALHPFFHCSQQITDWRLGRGVGAGGGEGYLLTGFSLDGSICSRLFRSAWLGGKGNRCKVRGGESCRREMLVLFGCGSLTNMSHYKQSACVFWGRGFGERARQWERVTFSGGDIRVAGCGFIVKVRELQSKKSHHLTPSLTARLLSCSLSQSPLVPPSVCLLKACGEKNHDWHTNIVILTVHPSTCLLQGEEAIVMSWKLHTFPPGKPVSPLQFQFARGIAIYQPQEHVK